MSKYVYILFTRSKTVVSYAIRFLRQDKYTHVSIGLKTPAGPYYSFGRYYRRFLLPAGLVKEVINVNSPIRIKYALYKIEVTEFQYEILHCYLRNCYRQRCRYCFNILGLLSAYYGLARYKPGYYFCSQFVCELLDKSGICKKKKDSAVTSPMDLYSQVISLGSLIAEGTMFELGSRKDIPNVIKHFWNLGYKGV